MYVTKNFLSLTLLSPYAHKNKMSILFSKCFLLFLITFKCLGTSLTMACKVL